MPKTIHTLEKETERCINKIRTHLCKIVMKNFNKKMLMRQQSHMAICPMYYSLITLSYVVYN